MGYTLATMRMANNMPYAALGGVMTGDAVERTSLNAYRFVAVNLAQLVVTGFTLPLVAKFAAGYAQNAAGSVDATSDVDIGCNP